MHSLGKCTGKKEDKFQKFSSEMTICAPGKWKNSRMIVIHSSNSSLSNSGPQEQLVAIEQCVAHMVCKVERIEETHDHFILYNQIEDALVLKDYWYKNKQFIPTRQDLAPYLTFLGSQTFSYTTGYCNLLEEQS